MARVPRRQWPALRCTASGTAAGTFRGFCVEASHGHYRHDEDMIWQQQMVLDVSARLPKGAELKVVGSAREPSLVDG